MPIQQLSPPMELLSFAVSGAILDRCQQAVGLAGDISPAAIEALQLLMLDPDPLVRSDAARALAISARALNRRRIMGLGLGQQRGPILTIDQLISQLLAGDRPIRFRAALAESLGGWDHESVLPALRHQLTDEAPEVRAEAAQALGQTQDQDAVAPLGDACQDDDARVREQAIRALGALARGEGVAPLARTLSGSPGRERALAAQSLGCIPTQQAHQLLLGALDDASTAVRWHVIEALAAVGQASAIPRLEEQRDSKAVVYGEPLSAPVKRALAAIEQRRGSLWIWGARLWYRLRNRLC